MAFERKKGFLRKNEGLAAWFEDEKSQSWLKDKIPQEIKNFEVDTYKEYCKTEGSYKQIESSNELPSELKKVIETSKQLLEYEDDWDEEGSLGYSKSTLDKAEKILTDNALTFWKNNAVWVTAPDFCPGPNGSIDLLWKLEDRELLINIPINENNLAGYYGDNFLNGSVIKGKLNLTEKNEWILMWLMK